jgi:hypothetical protein
MPEGCRKPAEDCEFAHIYLDGALEARRRAEAQGLLPPVADGGHEQPQPVAREAGDGRLARHRPEGPGAVPPPMPPPLQVPQAPAVWAGGNGGGGGGGGGYPQHSPALAPSYSYHSYMAPPEPPAEVFPPASRGPVVYDTRPTKIYVQMPRTRTGQRVCYYHNVGRCVNPSCPFLHVLVRVCHALSVRVFVLWYPCMGVGPVDTRASLCFILGRAGTTFLSYPHDHPIPDPQQVNMRALRASAVVLSRGDGSSSSNGNDGGSGIPAASPYMRSTVSAPPAAMETTYTYAPEVRGGLDRARWETVCCRCDLI